MAGYLTINSWSDRGSAKPPVVTGSSGSGGDSRPKVAGRPVELLALKLTVNHPKLLL